jgi:hypothetical protein
LDRYREREGCRVQRIDIFGERFQDVALRSIMETGTLRLGVLNGRILAATVVRRQLTLLLLAVMTVSVTAAYVLVRRPPPLAAITGALGASIPGGTVRPSLNATTRSGTLRRRSIYHHWLHNSHTDVQTEKMVAAGLMVRDRPRSTTRSRGTELFAPDTGEADDVRQVGTRP